MANYYNLLKIFVLLYLISLTKEYNCQDSTKISISPLGNCQTIEDLLNNETLTIKSENLLYLASDKEGKIEKNGYKLEIYKLNDTKLQSHNIRKSKLYIPNSCMNEMKSHSEIQLNIDEGIVIVVSDFNNINKNNIPDNYFIIRHNSSKSIKKYINSKNFDFSFCNKEPILYENEINIKDLKYNYTDNKTLDMDTILFGRKLGIDLFDPYSPFFNDICFKFTSEQNTDVTLDSRVEDYYQNITFCDDKQNSHYLAYNYTNTTIIYRCAFGFYQNEKDKSGYLDVIDTELKNFVSVSNFKVITCYKQFLNLRDIIVNYGGMICIIVLFIQIICFLLFCFLGIKFIKRQINDLFKLGDEIISRRQTLLKDINIETEKENDSKDNLKNVETNTNIPKNKLGSNPPKKDEPEKAENKTNNKNVEKNINIDNIMKKSVDINNKKIFEKNKDNLKNSISLKQKKKYDPDKETNIEVRSDTSQLYEYAHDELNEMPFKKAIKHDKRNFCSYYCNVLVESHIILNVFCRQSDYNLFVVKLGLLFMTFPINLTFNIFFFTNKSIKLNYVKHVRSVKDISVFWDNIANSVYSSILSTTVLIFLKYICLTHNSVRKLRKIKDLSLAKKKSVCVFRCIKIRIFIYYILSIAFIIIFGYYVLSFCAIFENTQMMLIKSTFTSWLISLVYPFIVYIIASILRSWSLSCKSKCLYGIKQILQWF